MLYWQCSQAMKWLFWTDTSSRDVIFSILLATRMFQQLSLQIERGEWAHRWSVWVQTTSTPGQRVVPCAEPRQDNAPPPAAPQAAYKYTVTSRHQLENLSSCTDMQSHATAGPDLQLWPFNLSAMHAKGLHMDYTVIQKNRIPMIFSNNFNKYY